MCRYTILVLLFFQLPSLLEAQIKKGFDFLLKKDTLSAQSAFEKDTAHSKNGIAAQYGLGLIQERKLTVNAPADSFLTIAKHLLELEGQLTKASASVRRRSAKYQVTPYAISVLRGKIRSKSKQALELSWNVLDYDRFIKEQPALAQDFKYILSKVRRKIVRRDYETAYDYPTLYSLIKNHQDILRFESLNLTNHFEGKLFQAFLESEGITSLETFIKEFPRHRISMDCWASDLAVAYKNKGRQGAIQFLIDYKLSVLDIHIVEDILSHQHELGDLTAAQQNQLDALKQQTYLTEHLKKMQARKVFEQVSAFAKREAPALRSYEIVQRGVQRLMDLDSLALATALLDELQPLYPDVLPDRKNCTIFHFHRTKQRWFDTARALLKRPDGNLVKSSLKTLNTNAEEFAPVVAANGKILYFCGSGREAMNDGEDVYVSRWKNNDWETPVLVSELSGEGNQSPLSLSPDGLTMLLGVDGKLHISHQQKKIWSKPRPLYSINNAFAWVGRASLSANSSILILEASNTLDPILGTKNVDLYISFLRNDTLWSKPVRLPAPVNTSYEERSPYLHSDNKTLYFASDGHAGLGEMDLFKTTRLDETWLHWSKPYNIGRKFNTIHDDWGINFSMPAQGNVGYLASASYFEYRNDLYSTGIPSTVQPQPTTVLELPIQTTGALTQHYLLTLIGRDGKVMRRERVRVEDGNIITTFPQDSIQRFVLEGDAIFPYSGTVAAFQTSTSDTVKLTNLQNMLEQNLAVPLPAIEFDKSKAVLKPELLPQLDLLADFLTKKPWMVTIIGHTDDSGTPETNQILSLQRADAVKTYLLTKVPQLKIQTQGLGSTQPKMVGNSDVIRQMNRRVEIKIQKLK